MSEETHKKTHHEKTLDKMTVKELREIAAGIPHERAIHDMKKEELIAFIREAQGIKEEAHAKKAKHAFKITLTKEQLKAKIRDLKVRKTQAVELHEKANITALAHQIGRLKKQTRHFGG